MAPCKNNLQCTNRDCPQSVKNVKITEDPDNISKKSPSWSFRYSDRGGDWSFTKEKIGSDFWDKIFQKLCNYESMTWGYIESETESHFIDVSSCNKCAKDRLRELNITQDKLFALRIEGTIRIYGTREKACLSILWYDNCHGDNDTCVCRSYKKHTGHHKRS